MRVPDLIARKRDGGELTDQELAWLIGGYLSGAVMEGQMAALLMAGVLQGFTEREAFGLTRAMVEGGAVLDLSGLGGPTIDKHSTGGVGDATTLLVAPLLAAAGARLVKLAGRGLGHSGGTLDKLESIPGLRVALTPDELLRIAADVGCVVAAQTGRLVPADRALYALRDVTATVASPALIASSVMSKKLAAGAEVIVLDVKAGSGAFSPTVEAASALARLCVAIGEGAGRRCVAVVSAMAAPLGRSIGNALEVAECVRLLGAPPEGRLAGLALELAALGLHEADGRDLPAARERLRRLWSRGAALERLARMVAAQGGDARVCEAPSAVLPQAPVRREVTAPAAGWVRAVPARAVGELAVALGAGRTRADQEVDPAVGVELAVEVGDAVAAGDPLAVVHARDDDAAAWACARLRERIVIGEAVRPPPTVLKVIRGAERDRSAARPHTVHR